MKCRNSREVLLCSAVALVCLAAADAPELLPPHGEFPPGFWEKHGTLILVCGVVVAILAATGLWLFLRPRPTVEPPADAEARAALEALRQLPEDGDLLSRVSRVVRRYCIRSFQLPPGEFTTTELARALASRTAPGDDIAARVTELLRQCDDRKFSAPNPDAPLGAVTRALELVAWVESRRAQTATPPVTGRQTGAAA